MKAPRVRRKARQLMAANHLDAILLADGTSLEYFAGVHWWGSERLFALVLPAKGRALCVCPAFEEGRARELLANSPEGKNADVRTWQEDQNPYQLLAQGLKDLNLPPACWAWKRPCVSSSATKSQKPRRN